MFKQKFISLLVFGLLSLHCSAYTLIDSNGKPTDDLKKLLALTGIEHTGELRSIVDATQKNWLRGRNKERWQMNHKKFDAKKAEIQKILFQEWDLNKPKQASEKHYKYGLVLGCTGPCMRGRFDYLISETKRGVKLDEIYFLVGDRPLSQEIESPQELQKLFSQKLPHNIKTEADVARLLVKSTHLPSALMNTKITVLSSPMKKNKDGKLIRPNTADTIYEWLKTSPQKGKALFISSGIFTGYQKEVVDTIFKEKKLTNAYPHETIGDKPEDNLSIPVCLDSIARELYQIQRKRSL